MRSECMLGIVGLAVVMGLCGSVLVIAMGGGVVLAFIFYVFFGISALCLLSWKVPGRLKLSE